MKVVTSYNNFSRAKLDHDLSGRFDLPIYQSGCDIFQNFITNFKGNAKFRSGFEMILEYENSHFIPFQFRADQNYICVFGENKCRFLSYASDGSFGWVVDNSNDILEIDTPYTLDEARELRYSQNFDVLVLAHNNHTPQDLIRVSANSFVIADHSFKGLSAPATASRSVFQIIKSTNSEPNSTWVRIIGTIPWNVGDFVSFSAVGGMTGLNGNSYRVTQKSSPYIIIDVDSRSFGNYTSGGTVTTSTQNLNLNGSPFASRSVTITGISKAYPAVITSNNHGFNTGDLVSISGVTGMTQINGESGTITRLTDNTFELNGVDSTNFTTYTSGGEALREGGNPSEVLFYKGRLYFASSTIRPTTVWSSEVADFSNFVLPNTVEDTSAMQFTIADISQPINWLFGGDNSLIIGASDGIVAVNGGGVNQAITPENIEANLTSANPCNRAYPLKKDGFVFYVGADGRNVYYFNYDLLSESFVARDANITSYDVTRSGIRRLFNVYGEDDLIFMQKENGSIVSLNFRNAGNEEIVGWHNHTTDGLIIDIVKILNNEGAHELFILANRDGDFFIERMARIPDFVTPNDFFTNDKDADKEAYNRYVAEQMKGCCYLDNSQTFYYLNDNIITFDPDNGTITATSPVFVSGDVGRHIDYRTITGYESGRFLITGYVSDTVVNVDVLQEPTSNVYRYWYMTFNSIGGLSMYNGKTVSVVADGGYLDDFEISGGMLNLGRQCSQIWVGLPYFGIIKSFPLGFQVNAQNTQTTAKYISKVGMRFVNTAGGLFGTNPYDMNNIQELTQNELNYLPPVPMDGTKYVVITDNSEKDKVYYIGQDKPLPMNVCAIMIDGVYGLVS